MTEKKMKKTRRVLAWIGLAVILAMYVISFVCAILATPNRKELFVASAFCTIAVPIFIYIILMFLRLNKRNVIEIENENNTESEEEK